MTGPDTPDRRDTDDLEWRLHAMLSARADAVDAEIDGPALRARHDARSTPSALRRAAPVLAAAAIVLGLAGGVTAIALDSGHSGDGRPLQPGGSVSGTVGSSSTPSPTISARPTPISPPGATPTAPTTVPSRPGVAVTLPNVVVPSPGVSSSLLPDTSTPRAPGHPTRTAPTPSPTG